MRFENKTVLITGAAGTIGRAVAKAFYEEGSNIALVDFNPEALKKCAEEEGFVERTLLLTADVTDEQQTKDYVQKTVDTFGSIDVFHNNAGITGQRLELHEMDIEKFKKLLNVNVVGVTLGLKYVLEQMYKQGSGSIINTSSHKGKICAEACADYGSSKSAVIMLTKVAALEAAPKGVRVNCIMPGIVKSPMIIENRKRRDPSLTDEAIAKIFAESLPIGRWCYPEEIANMIMFLSSPEASYITGMELRFDGGTTAHYL